MTATALNLTGMSPLKINSTVLAITDLALSPEVEIENFRHSGYEFPSVGVVPGARPMARFKTPFGPAYTLFSMKLLQATVLEIYYATFASGLRQAGANHYIHALATSAKAACYMEGASVGQNGILMADIVVALLSSDGLTHPLAALASGATLPTLGSEPQLHTLGPFAIGSGPTRIDGLTNQGFRQNISLAMPKNDGDAYPRACAIMGMDPMIMGEHESPIALLTELGLMGEAVPTNAQAFFRGIDPTTQLLQTTGMKLAVTAGRAIPMPVQFDLNRPAKMGFGIRTLSSTSTHPITVTAAAALP